LGPEERDEFIKHCQELYRRTLLEDVLPFWMKYGLDKKNGGISNVLDDAGKVLSEDKYIWSQGRALWTFSAIYNRVQRRTEWLGFAEHIYQYLVTHGRDDRGRWMYRLDAAGKVLEKDTSIYVDGFVMTGMGEYYQATGDENALSVALETYDNTLARIHSPGSYGIAPYSIPPGMKALGVPMIFSFFYSDLARVAGRCDIHETAIELAHEVLDDFYMSEKDALLEFVTLEGEALNSPEGRTCVPGHGIEALWFLISIFEEIDADILQSCCRLIRRHLELAWDEQYGGLRLAIDIDGVEPPFWPKHDYKPWWVQVEALIATAYAYLHTREDWCLAWHKQIQEYAFSHYPVSTGEWTQWLDRYGNKAETAALPVKDPYHLPRGLIYLMELFEHKIPIPQNSG